MLDLFARIERLLLHRDAMAAHDPSVQQELRSIWSILGKPLTRPYCQDCLYQKMIELRNLDFTKMKKRVSQLKDGQFVMVPFSSDSYDNTTLTDAIARRILKEYPALESSFKKLPPDEPVEGDEDFADPDALQKQEEELKQQQSLQAENEQLKKELEALRSAGIKPAAPQPLPESANAAKAPAAPVQKDIPPVKDAK
jgi:hypothetical protein